MLHGMFKVGMCRMDFSISGRFGFFLQTRTVRFGIIKKNSDFGLVFR
jgi:hypothetical protein